MKKTLLTLLLIPALLGAGSPRRVAARPPDNSTMVTCFIVVVVVGTGITAIILIKRWCDKYLGTNSTPPGMTNDCSALSLCSPVSGPTPFSLQSGPPFADAMTFTASYLGSNCVEVTCWTNGNVAGKAIAAIDGQGVAQVSFPAIATTNAATLFRMRDEVIP